MLLSPPERLELGHVIATVLQERGLVAQMEPLAVTPEAAAQLLGVTPRTIWTLRKRGELEAFTIGRAIRVPVASLRAYMARHKEASHAA